MSEINYVSETSISLARDWEARFVSLPSLAGILFISIIPVPAKGGNCFAFQILLGLNRERKLEHGTGVAMCHKVLEDIIDKYPHFTFSFKICIGVAGADCDQNIKKLNTDSSEKNDSGSVS